MTMRRSAALRSGVDMERLPARDSGPSRKRELADGEDRLLLERARLGLRLILVGVAIVLAGALVIYPGRTLIHVVQGINLLAVAVAARLLTDPGRRTFNLAVG